MKYYAFEWCVSIGYTHSDGSFAGFLYAFDTASKRDKWVDAGPPIDSLGYRMIVTPKWVKTYAKDHYPLSA